MKTTIVLISDSHKRRALSLIESLPLNPVHEVVIRERKKNRSLDANALYWQWLTVIGNELGESKDDLHERYKDKFLVSLYERDDADFAEMIQSLRDVYRQGMKTQAVALRKRIVALTSTTTATTAQMSEYMQCVELDAAELGIRLPFPEER